MQLEEYERKNVTIQHSSSGHDGMSAKEKENSRVNSVSSSSTYQGLLLLGMAPEIKWRICLLSGLMKKGCKCY
jgi:hypothetical protein